jgi:hypothetical protein
VGLRASLVAFTAAQLSVAIDRDLEGRHNSRGGEIRTPDLLLPKQAR